MLVGIYIVIMNHKALAAYK